MCHWQHVTARGQWQCQQCLCTHNIKFSCCSDSESFVAAWLGVSGSATCSARAPSPRAWHCAASLPDACVSHQTVSTRLPLHGATTQHPGPLLPPPQPTPGAPAQPPARILPLAAPQVYNVCVGFPRGLCVRAHTHTHHHTTSGRLPPYFLDREEGRDDDAWGVRALPGDGERGTPATRPNGLPISGDLGGLQQQQ